MIKETGGLGIKYVVEYITFKLKVSGNKNSFYKPVCHKTYQKIVFMLIFTFNLKETFSLIKLNMSFVRFLCCFCYYFCGCYL
jgi:hypothetical protein